MSKTINKQILIEIMKIKSLVLFLIILFSADIYSVYGQKKFYVSPDGNDNWSGTINEPFRTLNKAKNVVRIEIKSDRKDIYIYLRGGKYQLDSTLNFFYEDGGVGDQKIIYKAYGLEKPIITGGSKISDWKTDKNGIYKAKISGPHFRQLYVDGKKAIRARQPDTGFFRLTGWDLKGQNLIIPASEIENWNNFKQVEMALQQYWSESYLHLDSFQKYSGGAELAYISIDNRQKNILFKRGYPQKQDNAAFHFENAYEFITEPGEWYLDRNTNELFYMPDIGVDILKSEITAPSIEKLINISGTTENPVENLVFEGLTFTASNWDLPTVGSYLNMQAGMYSSTNDSLKRPPSAIHICEAQNILFEKNIFQNLGSTAIDLEYNTKNCQIKGNIIRDIAGNGIVIGSFSSGNDEFTSPNSPDLKLISFNDVISNNYIIRTGCEYYGTCGISAGYASGLHVENNVLRDMPYSGISLGWGWSKNESSLRDNVIGYNDISDVVNLLCDGGAIYTLSMQPGTKIIGNYIHNMSRSEWAGAWPIAAIYNDEGSGGTLEKPMILQENITPVWNEGIRQLYFHKTGIILLNINTFYEIREQVEKSGIREEYRDFVNDNIHE